MNGNTGIPRGAKRQRLSLACTQCRKRKVRCDEGQPQCGNCTSRGDQCITINPRNPGFEAERRRTNRSVGLAEGSAGTPNITSRRQNLNHSPASSFIRDLASSTTSGTQLAASPSHLSASSSVSSHTTHSLSHNNLDQRGGSNVARSDITAVSSPYNSDMITNTDATSHKRKLVGGNTLQSLARVPEATDRLLWLSTFVDRIYPICPVFEISRFKETVEILAHQDLRRLSATEIPVLMSVYAVFALAADEHADKLTASGLTYLTAAYGLYGHVVSMPYRSSAQALVLLAFALRGRHKEGAAWQVLGQAIRISQSIGLHRRPADSSTLDERYNLSESETLDARIWWTCYCLEMTMGLEVGRPISIRDVDCDQIIPKSLANDGKRDFLPLWIGLAQIQNKLIEVIYHRSPNARNAWSLLGDIGRIDQLLCEWDNAVEPNEIRPSLDLLCAPHELHLATFLATNYYQTMITLHQAAFMLDTRTYQATIDDHCHESPVYARLSGSQKILVNSARKMANLQLDLSDRRLESRLFTASQSMFVVLILSLNIIKHPNERRIYSDLELLKSSSKYVEDAYSNAGQHPDFIKAIVTLRDRISQKVLSNYIGKSTNQETFPDADTSERQAAVSGNMPFGNNGSIHAESWIGDLQQEALWGLDVLEDPWRWLLIEDGAPDP